MKKLLSLFTLIFCTGLMQANGGKAPAPWWSAIITEKQVEQAKQGAKLFAIKAALWTARSQEKGSLIAPIKPTGYLIAKDCAFFPNKENSGAGWVACLIKGGLEYGKAESDCGLPRKGISKGFYSLKIGRFSNVISKCRVYPTGAVS